MRKAVLAATIALVGLAGCKSTTERAERDRVAVARRITEICSLPPAEREAALERLNKESGLVLVCGN